MFKSFWFWLLILSIAIQPFSLEIKATLPIDKDEELQAPTEVLSILKRSCYDCHSSDVKAPWYYNVAPISWYTQLHVKNARKIVNFSKWNSYTKEQQLVILKKIPKAIVIRMPLNSYLYAHSEAQLTQNEKKILKKWAITLKEKTK